MLTPSTGPADVSNPGRQIDIQVLTCTGDRPLAFALCCGYMARQSYAGAVRWIVVDDGECQAQVVAPAGWDVTVIRLPPRPGVNTQAQNMLAGLAEVDPTIPLAIVEDDDVYPPYWLGMMEKALERADLAGQDVCRKYNVATGRAWENANPGRSCLCSTAVKGPAVDALAAIARRGVRLMDMDLWRLPKLVKRQVAGCHVTGMKGMPGRAGIDRGHRPEFGNIEDPDGRLLRAWLGFAARPYLELRGLA
jgi:hypothetical protein